jgi:DNA-binding response OmpR family regulator
MASRNPPKALLIDDDPIQLRIREAVLREAGVEVCTATTPDSAVGLLRSDAEGIGVVVTDHIMPQASGSEFVRRLRAVNTSVPVLVVSGLAEAEDEYEGLNVTFRQKPCPPLELIALVRAALQRSH